VQLTTAGTTALVLDDPNNYLIRSEAGTKTATSLPKPSQAQKIIAMANIGPDVYMLDVAGSQVWRYADAVAGNSPAPTGFFPNNAPDIAQATAFVLDDKALYILKQNGTVLKFDNQANQQKFAITMRAALPGINGASNIFTDQGLNYVWIADSRNGRIVQLDKSGNYVRSYVSGTNIMDLSQIKGVVVPPGGKTLYVLSGKKLYDFPTQS
jgi:DNA-binding beta-propeller fold protein YncE